MSGEPPRTLTAEVPRIEQLGDGALLVTFGDAIDVDLNERAHRLAEAVEGLRATDRRFGPAIPAYASVLIPFDPVDVDPDEARAVVAGLLENLPARMVEEPRDVLEIPVRYGGDDGPDLAEVAALHDLRPGDVVDLHSGTEYRVFFLGAVPGFAYLGSLPDLIATPRLATPREHVPAGSVAIADAQTGIYPFTMPGGWRIIGRTDAPMWDLRRDQPSLLRPGDRVRFVPIG